MSSVKNIKNRDSASSASGESVKNIKSLKNNFFVLILLAATCLASSAAYGMDNNEGAQEARRWMALANEISYSTGSDTPYQQLPGEKSKEAPAPQNQLSEERLTLRDRLSEEHRSVYDELSEESQRVLDSYSQSAVVQTLGDLATSRDFRTLVIARSSGTVSPTQELEWAVELRLLSLLAHMQKAVTQEKEKEHSAAFKWANRGWCGALMGGLVCVGSLITWWGRTPECPRAY